jgi:hypothetical protein
MKNISLRKNWIKFVLDWIHLQANLWHDKIAAFASTHDSCGSQTPKHSLEAKVVSINWYLQRVYAQQFYPTLVLF